MRSTRDLLRRRNYLARIRAELLGHIQNTNSQCNLPAFEKRITYRANRLDAAERFSDPSVRTSMEANLELIEHLDRMKLRLETFILRHARVHDPQALHLIRTIPGVGKVLSLVLLYEIHDIDRFPTVQDFASYARLVKCAKQSAGKQVGSSGKKIGNAHLKWAFSEAAVLLLRDNPQAQRTKQRLEKKHGKTKALSILAHKLGRATYYVLKRGKAFDMNKFLAS
jgi:transposase